MCARAAELAEGARDANGDEGWVGIQADGVLDAEEVRARLQAPSSPRRGERVGVGEICTSGARNRWPPDVAPVNLYPAGRVSLAACAAALIPALRLGEALRSVEIPGEGCRRIRGASEGEGRRSAPLERARANRRA